MKKYLLILLVFAASPSQAIGFGNAKATVLKNAAMKACKAQVKKAPENMREKTQKTCDCTVENTDFEAMVKNQEEGDTTQMQEDALKIAQECASNAL